MSLHNPQSRTRAALWRGRLQGSIATAAAMIAIGLSTYAMTAIDSVTTIRPTPKAPIAEPMRHHHAAIPPCTDWTAKDCIQIDAPNRVAPYSIEPYIAEPYIGAPMPYQMSRIYSVPEPSTLMLLLGVICVMLVLSRKR